MIDINLIRNNKELVINNIKNKFQDHKIVLVDEILELDKKVRSLKVEGDNLRQERNNTSNEIGLLMREKKIEEANSRKNRVKEINELLVNIEKEESELSSSLKEKMMMIPNIIADDVPIGEDDSKNVEEARFG